MSKFDFREFNLTADKIARVSKGLPQLLEQQVSLAALDVIADTRPNTPVDTGQLRRGWATDPVKHTGSGYLVDITNAMDYAKFVEEGYRVHGSSTFVPGKFMAHRAVNEQADKMQIRVQHAIINAFNL